MFRQGSSREHPVILDSGYSGCLCFLVLRWAFYAFGCHYGALGMRLGFWISFSGLLWATGHGRWGAWVFLSGAAAFRVWGLGLWLFLITSEYGACVRQ